MMEIKKSLMFSTIYSTKDEGEKFMNNDNKDDKWKWLKIVLGIILLIGGIYLASRSSYLLTKY